MSVKWRAKVAMRRPFARTYIDLWRRGPVLIHLAHCNNHRWRARRLHCGTQPTAWRTRRLSAALGIRAGWWLLSVGVFRRPQSLTDPVELPTPGTDGEPPPQPDQGEPEVPR